MGRKRKVRVRRGGGFRREEAYQGSIEEGSTVGRLLVGNHR